MAYLRVLAVGGFVAAFSCILGVGVARAVPVVWTGPATAFSKTGFDDENSAEFQDRLTDNVWLTRGSSDGPFNIAPGMEMGYVRYTSPAGTQWATGAMAANAGKTIAATNYAQLTFTDWAPAFGGPGAALLGNILTRNAVVHLVSDDIYLDLQFTNFTATFDGTIMAYTRSTPAPSIVPTGDYNGNGVVDAADYVLWRKTLNQSADPAGSGADGDGDGTIGPGDNDFWRARFGNTVPGAGSGTSVTTVPEPASAVLLLTLLLFFNRRSK